jgi:quercetin dioxygenase-like cupin family protein
MGTFADVASIPPQHVWAGVVGRAVHGERMTFSVVELAPGAVVPEHSHESEQLGILIVGSLTFRIGEEVRECTPGDTWRILGNVPHSVVTGEDGAVVAEAFSPPRDDWLGLETDEPRAPHWP